MKNIYRNKILFFSLIIILTSVILQGCFNYKDINKVTFVTSCVFDNQNDNVVLYLDCVKPFRSTSDSSDKGKRIIYQGSGKSVFEAVRSVNLNSAYKLNFTQCKAFIFSENAAKQGINKYVDVLRKDQEFLVKPFLFVFFGDIDNMFKTVESDEEYLGLFLNDLVVKTKENPRSITLNMNDFLVKESQGQKTVILSALDLKKDVENNRIKLNGGAVLENNKLVTRLNLSDALSYSFLNDEVKSGTLEVSNPNDPNSFITLEILNSKTKTSINYEDDRVKLYKDIKVKCSIAEAQNRFITNIDVVNNLKEIQEENMKKYLNKIFNDYKEKHLDIFSINRMFEIKYPKESYEGKLIDRTDLILNIDVEIQGSSTVKDSI